METTRVENFELPDGSIYTGECIKNDSWIELKGKGEINYPNGDKYIGEFAEGSVRGKGKYLFSDGDIHYGHFYDGIPNGIGYLNKQSYMCMGNFSDGLLNGWALRINGFTNFGWWKDGILIKEEVSNIKWVFGKINSVDYDKSFVQIFKNGMFGFGLYKFFNRKDFIHFFYGVLFLKDGSVSVGLHYDLRKVGQCVFFKPNGNIEYAEYLYGNFIEKSPSDLVRTANIDTDLSLYIYKSDEKDTLYI